VPAETPDLEALLAEAREAFARAESAQDLVVARSRYLGRKGSVSQLLRGIGALPPEERAHFGDEVNRAKREIEALADARQQDIASGRTRQALSEHRLDVSLPGAGPPVGHLHPLTLITRDMVRFFASLGFSIEEGPEVETDFHNFEALNIPPDPPSRDMQDTFYVEGDTVLRTHTSNVQIRAMTGRTPPFRFIAPGRVYRHDLSPRHSPMFKQIEGFLVDGRVSFGDLKGVLLAFGKHLFGPKSCASAPTTSPSRSPPQSSTTRVPSATARAARSAPTAAGWSGAAAG
jgi:phenylalanyl-tRNA synthetase alpha chain